MKLGKIVQTLLLILALGVFIYSGYHVFDYWQETKASKDAVGGLIDDAVTENTAKPEHHEYDEVAPITVDFEKLRQTNSEVVGWIYSADTPINNPIAQADDNSKYLYQLFDGTWNANGCIFLDFRNSSDFSDFMSTLHGHHMINRTMFGSLSYYKDQSYFDKHPVMYLMTPEQNYRIELVAGRITDVDSVVYDLNYTTDAQKQELLDYMYAGTTFNSGIQATIDDRFLLLSTCSYEFDNARYVVLGRMVEIG